MAAKPKKIITVKEIRKELKMAQVEIEASDA